VTDRHTHTDRQTDRHTTTAYTALSIASRGKNLVNFDLVTPEVMRLICVPVYLAKSTFICHAGISKWIGHGNANWHINIGDDPRTSCINFMGFWPLTPEIMRLNCVRQAVISTGVSLAKFAKGRTAKHEYMVLFCYCLLGGDIAMPGEYMLGFATHF